jgi:hypothetical protein
MCFLKVSFVLRWLCYLCLYVLHCFRTICRKNYYCPGESGTLKKNYNFAEKIRIERNINRTILYGSLVRINSNAECIINCHLITDFNKGLCHRYHRSARCVICIPGKVKNLSGTKTVYPFWSVSFLISIYM